MTGGAGPIEVVAAAIFRDGRCLLGRRPEGEPYTGGCWEFPGGKVRSGESPPEALERELREELAVEVEVGERLARVEHAYPDRRIGLALYRCRLRGGEPRALCHLELRWFRPVELDSEDLAAADRQLLASLA